MRLERMEGLFVCEFIQLEIENGNGVARRLKMETGLNAKIENEFERTFYFQLSIS
jgi:hypothetical protein